MVEFSLSWRIQKRSRRHWRSRESRSAGIRMRMITDLAGVDMKALSELTWFVWFLPMIFLMYLAVLTGGTAVAWYLLGWKSEEDWYLGFVSVMSIAAFMWWMGRGQKYQRAKV